MVCERPIASSTPKVRPFTSPKAARVTPGSSSCIVGAARHETGATWPTGSVGSGAASRRISTVEGAQLRSTGDIIFPQWSTAPGTSPVLVLVGHSMGGKVAQIVVARRPAPLAGKGSGRICRNQFPEKVYVALRATCSSHHAFFAVKLPYQEHLVRM